MKKIQFQDYAEGDTFAEMSIGPIQQEDLNLYAAASGDMNPIHRDVKFAKAAGLKGTIAHGMYVMAQVGRFSSERVHPGQITSLAVKFKDMTYPGQVLVCSGIVKKKKEENGKKFLIIALEVRCTDDGKTKMTGDLKVLC